MALFKIFKGNETAKLTDSTATGYRVPTDGYAYYDTSSKLFYIDAAYGADINDITRAPINANIANMAMNGVYYGTCSTAQSTKTKVVTLINADGFKLATGVMVAIKFTYASAASTMTLNVNNTGAKNLVQYGTTAMSSTTSTNGWPANAVVPFVYDGARWIRFYWSNSTYYYTSAYSDTSAGTAEKAGKSSAAQTLTGSRYFEFQLLNDNTVSGAITLNMNSLGAKTIYINGEPSSSSNHTLPKGCYLVYYDADGDNGNGCYHFRTDNQLPGNLAGNAATATYATTAGTANSVAWANVDGAPGEASTTTAGFMSADDKTKLNSIATGAEVNQNTFSKVAVSGQNTVEADSKTDTLTLAGSNVTLTTNATSDTVTIGITAANVTTALGYTPPQQDTTYSNATTSAAGLMSADDKTKLNGIETGAQVNKLESVTASGTAPLTLSAGTITNKSIAISGSIADATTNAKGVVKIGDGINVTDGTISVTAASVGLSSAMLFKGSLGTNGTITDLPAASADNQGYTYKVITANTYTNTSGPAKVGDVFVSDGSQWVLIPSGDEPDGTVTSITLIAGTGISLDTDNTAITTSGSRTITNTGVTGVKGESESTYRTGQVNIADHSYTPAGSVTVTPTVTVNTTTVNSITAVGTLPSHGADTFSKGTLPSFTRGTFSQGTLPSHAADTFSKGTLPSFTRGTFSAGTLPSLSMSVTNEVLSFTWSAGTLPSHAADTFSAGTLPSYTQGTFSAGTLPTHAADTFSAGTLPSFTQGTFSAGTLPTKGDDTTVATGIDTATATASFSGTPATLSHTVS